MGNYPLDKKILWQGVGVQPFKRTFFGWMMEGVPCHSMLYSPYKIPTISWVVKLFFPFFLLFLDSC